ncbi:hypothetical protein TKK_0000108 [Trichogramma kaykai]
MPTVPRPALFGQVRNFSTHGREVEESTGSTIGTVPQLPSQPTPFSCHSCQGRHHTLIQEDYMSRSEPAGSSKRARLTAAATSATPPENWESTWEQTSPEKAL